ncbi:unnamed protein product [Urochloa decumbens]|uniref:Protein kinase domain-containing protein n=1 Tax=Urochloa decumbens TaxID=240449 RepID=A0ABC9BKX3_9POAL
MEKVGNRGVVAVVAAVISALLSPTPFGRAAVTVPESSCTRSCGNISIFYPFGVEPGCYHAAGFNVTCNHDDPPKLFIGDGTVQVIDIFLSNSTVLVNSSSMELVNGGGGDGRTVNTTWGVGFPYYLSEMTHNMLHAQGCNIQVDLRGGVQNNLIGSCTAMCSSPSEDSGMYNDFSSYCTGIGCCQTGIILGYSSYNIQIHYLHNLFSSNTSTIYIVDDNEVQMLQFPSVLPMATLEWVISNSTCPTNGSAPECLSAHSSCSNTTAKGHDGYICECVDGHLGNPYVLDGCQALEACAHLKGFPCHGDCLNLSGNFYCQCPKGTYGDPFTKDGCIEVKKSLAGLSVGIGFGSSICLLILVLVGPFIIHKIKLQKVKKRKEKFFKQNHGLLLQQFVSQNVDIGERMIITLGELEKATNNFDRARVIGGGGHGVVFKGIIGLHVVAIKKSKIVVQREIDEFINEVAVLSQVNHRNVVKLLGCCLETEVPLLVYEFISNGTLYHHLHVDGPTSLPWVDRKRIALEVARALSYLHSAASMPIFHRDIKSSNILLDDSLTAKVSDFGASRYIPIDKTGVTTAVQGTIGYLDPMYYYTGRLTDKSDVFSFGVLLIELLTRKKPYVYRSVNDDGLVSHFVSLLREGNLVDIIDPQVIDEEHGEIQEVATLAAICTKLNREDRPTMREVEMTLENLLVKKTQSTTPTIYDGIQNTTHYMPTGRDTKEASRHYSMEEEMMLSARYPR